MKINFSHLATKMLTGKATENDKQLFQKLLDENSENALIFNQLKEYYNANVNFVGIKDKLAFEENLWKRIEQEPIKDVHTVKIFYHRVAVAAAMIFMVMTCSLGYLYLNNSRTVYTYAAQSVPVEYTLEDGTVVKLNKNSELKFNNSYGKKNRNVKLKGEAFFKVTKDKVKPFIVEVQGTKTEVLGTTFNVKMNEVLSEISITLVEGAVRFNGENMNLVLVPGDEVIYNTITKAHRKIQTDTQLNTVWALNRYNYNNLTFAAFADKLERIYQLNIEIKNKSVGNRIISASFLAEEPIEKILHALEDELKFKFEKKKSNEISIY
jgi:ferric-dicitrate binding protein FerR (iron transport regulator)